MMFSSLKGKAALVTGGAGFIGQHLIDKLLLAGCRVSVIDNFLCGDPSVGEKYKGQVKWFNADIRDARALETALQKMDVVFHLAAIRSVVKSVEDPLLSHEVNATGTLLLLDLAAKARVKQVIFTSTSAVYGDAISSLQKEEGPFKPVSPYGMAKFLGEQYSLYYFKTANLPVTIFRIFNVYGPRQNPESKYSLVIPGMMQRILQGKAPVVDGDGRQSRDFVYIDDVLEAFSKSLFQQKAYGEIFNLGDGKTHTILEIASKLLKYSGSKAKAEFGPKRPADPKRTCADISKAKKKIDWKPIVNLDEGLKRTVQWYLKNQK